MNVLKFFCTHNTNIKMYRRYVITTDRYVITTEIVSTYFWIQGKLHTCTLTDIILF